MRLLVSVRDAEDAVAALDGGADFIDAKDPEAGALGAVHPATFEAICRAAAGLRPVTAALGDAIDEETIAHAAQAFAVRGASLVKVGFAGTPDPGRAAALLASAVRGARAGATGCGVIAVGYADDVQGESIPLALLVDLAGDAGAAGVLVDTRRKDGPGLPHLIPVEALADWSRRAHAAGLIVALAGRLTPGGLAFARRAGADVAGVRGAACEGGRRGRVSAAKVRDLAAAASSEGPPHAGAAMPNPGHTGNAPDARG